MKAGDSEPGRTRAPWRLSSAPLYDRYARPALPGWGQWAIGGSVLGLGAVVGWLAVVPHLTGDFERLLALLLPFVAAAAIFMVRAAVSDRDGEED